MDSVAHDITEAGVQMSTDNPIWRIHNLEHDLRFTCYPVQSIIISCQPSSANPTIHRLRIPLGSIIQMKLKNEKKAESCGILDRGRLTLPPPEVEFRRRGGGEGGFRGSGLCWKSIKKKQPWRRPQWFPTSVSLTLALDTMYMFMFIYYCNVLLICL